MTRFAFQINPLLRPLFLVIGVRPATAYIELTDEEMQVAFGKVQFQVGYHNIGGVEPHQWWLWYGLGVRPARGGWGLVSSYAGTVAVRFHEEVRFRAWPVTAHARRLVVSLEQPDAFIQELERRLSAQAR